MSLRLRQTDLYVLNMRTRMPFRYGIVSMTALPHLFVRCELEINGKLHSGVAADGLAPKWFTKDPATSLRDDWADMLRITESACALARQIESAPTVFDLWQQTYQAQERWAQGTTYPPLLWSFGVSLVERALIEAFCRAQGVSFSTAVRRNLLGIRLGQIHPELAEHAPAGLLPERPRRTLIARHTVGLGDPLREEDIPAAERIDDGLPQSLEACIRAYGLTHFKIKLHGDLEKDRARLQRIASLLDSQAVPNYAFTLDGNEQYHAVEPFQALWRALIHDAALAPFLSHLLFVEQPLHRDIALSEEVGRALARWPHRPPLLIDESDGQLDSARTALALGYIGTSHKNCKGVFKGIANACLIAHRQRTDPQGRYLLSGEDLANVGPVALLQDLAVMACLGIEHVERNGHHYFTGLSMLPAEVQEQVLAHHPDLYRRHERGYATLAIQKGRLEVGSVVDSPFGLGFAFDPSRFTPRAAWDPESLEAS
ncbi:MAG TPA: hypothetical protein VFB38_16150 [Chthonomonadaceae bacterium]|nr:hypothetical protein [Chthonomonadaceae bacterium]